MTRHELAAHIAKKRSYLIVGLDTDITKVPAHLQSQPNPVFEFNKQIIDATADYCVGYKINTAFYEAMGARGWETMEKTAHYIPRGHFKIADAKRGDIGNTSTQYALAFFQTLDFDAVTVAPYMGADSVKPFLEFEGKWAIVLGLTSNAGAQDFELQKMATLEPLYETVMRTVSQWGTTDNIMFVVGATQPQEFAKIRKITPHHFYLVPGVGIQGGTLKDISENAMIADAGLLVNVSRAIIYAGEGADFAKEATAISKQYQFEMAQYLP